MTRILIIRFSSIGDIVLTTPVIRALKQQLRGVEIHYLTKEAFRKVLENDPHIDQIHTIKKEIQEVLPELRRLQFDHIVDLHKNFRSRGVRIRLRRPASSFPKLNWEKWLLVRFKRNMLPRVHIVDRYFDAVWKLGVNNDGQGLDFYVDPAERPSLPGLDLKDDKPYAAFIVGAKHQTKCLPVEKIVEIIDLMNIPVLLLGGQEDRATGEAVMKMSKGTVIDGCGKFSIQGSAALVRRAAVVITHDTGLMHIAAAFRKKIISIWGSTVPDFGMYPYLPPGEGASEMFEVEDLPCRPCSKIGFDRCPKGHFDCMMKQDTRAIAALAMQFAKGATH